MAACAFWLASKVAKILAGTLRFGSGITGFGGVWVAPVVDRRLVLRAHLHAAVAGLRRGLRNRHGLRESRRRRSLRRMWRSEGPVRNAARDGWMCCVIRYFGSLFDEASRCRPFYRAFDQRRYRFSVKIRCAESRFGAGTSKIRPLPPRPEFRACRRDSPARRCLRVPSAPSTTRRGYSRFAAGVECRKSRPCGRA